MYPNCLVALLLAFLTPLALASEDRWTGYYLGLEGGLLDKSDTSSPEVDNSGYELGVKAGWSGYNKNWTADVGLGYRTDKMDDNGIEVKTNAFLLEAGLRWRPTRSRWSLGPELHVLLGEDVSFSDTGTNSDDNSTSVFLGGRIMYDFFEKPREPDFRLGFQALTDIDIDRRQITQYQLVAEWLWPWEKRQAPAEPPVVEKTPDPVAEEPEPRLKLNLKAAGVRFASASSDLNPRAKEVIQKLANVLSNYQSEWQLIKVDGHTDITGSYEKNIALSRARADSIRSQFITSGIVETKIVARGFGPDRPLVNERNSAAYAQNRRVELNLISDNATDKFVSDLNGVIKGLQ